MIILPQKPNFVSKWEPTAWRYTAWRFVASSDDGAYLVVKHPFTSEIAVLINQAAIEWCRVQVNVYGLDVLQALAYISKNEQPAKRELQVLCPECEAALILEFREFLDFDADAADSGAPFLMPVAQCDACNLLVLFPGDDIVTIPLRKE